MSAYVGLDVHKDFTFATVLDQTGRVVVQRKLANEYVPSCARADRAYILESGKIVLEGKGRELLNLPSIKEAYLGV